MEPNVRAARSTSKMRTCASVMSDCCFVQNAMNGTHIENATNSAVALRIQLHRSQPTSDILPG